MSAIPIFIEVPDAPEVAICAPAVQSLLEQGVQPVGLATHLQELKDILTQLRDNGLAPGIFIVNTYKAKDIIPELDALMGDQPAVFLRRALYAGQSGLMEHFAVDTGGKQTTLEALGKLKPRLTSIWTYGGKNADQVRQRLLKCLARYMADGLFTHFEIENRIGAA